VEIKARVEAEHVPGMKGEIETLDFVGMKEN